MQYLILVLFVFEVGVLVYFDRQLFGTFITPITILSIPYLIIVILAIIVGPSLGFVQFYYPSLWIWIIGLPIFWIPGFLLACVLLQKTNIHHYPYSIINNFKFDNVIFKLTYLVIVVLIYGFVRAYNKSKIGSDNFELAFGSGFSGHTLLISKFFFIYLLVRFRKRNITPITILILFYIFYGVKSWIIIPVLSAILITILLRRIDLSISILIKILGFGLVVFYIVYRIALGPTMPISFVFIHFLRYLFSGVLGISQYIGQKGDVGIDPTVIIDPIINIYNKLTGREIHKTFSNILTNIGCDSITNVKTFFGTVYIYAGFAWGCVFSFCVGTVSYLFLISSIKTRNIILLIIYGTYLTLIFFGWFDTYSSNLFFYEFPIFGLLLFLVYHMTLKIENS